ncbi:hypothetical protein EB796_014519 [Bugula neritina]|uniref:Uncharacterized protein n=1 Tax=Bugula neritina TaxID=10212 RepID=A0A7J7JLN1_BUGNE|nr:hypothetical protein EB796_014519 [Bugula neritina]
MYTVNSKDSHAVTDSPPVFTHSANSHSINSNLTPTQVDTKDSNVSQSEGSEKILSASDQTNETVSTASGQGDKIWEEF